MGTFVPVHVARTVAQRQWRGDGELVLAPRALADGVRAQWRTLLTEEPKPILVKDILEAIGE